MPKVSLLYINDSVVAPHLLLLRQVCEPTSTSKPHVTVRYFDRLEVPELYKSTQIRYVDLVEPGMFKPKKGERAKPSPVFIRCRSDDLTHLEHKPHFPESEFHVTIYDGPSSDFAHRILKELQRIEWYLRVPFRKPASLVIKEIKGKKAPKTAAGDDYPIEAKKLYLAITGQELEKAKLLQLSDNQRLRLFRKILSNLEMATARFRRIAPVRIGEAAEKPKFHESGRLSDVHLTPPELAAEITRYAVSQLDSDSEKIHFGDPAVGTGAFYAALLQVVRRERIATAIGVDLNPEQAAAATWRWAHRGMTVLNEDYLHLERLPLRSLILANPPYLRHQYIPKEYKAELLRAASLRTTIPISARSGLYVYFLLLAHDWMQLGAVAAWLIPSEFMTSVYGSAVRRYLTDKVELVRVHVYGRAIPRFENAEVAPSVVIFRNHEPRLGHKALLTLGGDLTEPEIREEVPLYELRAAATWRVPFATRRKDQPECRLGDLFSIKRGIATGANAFFILTRQRAKELKLPKVALRPLLPKSKLLETDVIETDADGYPLLSPQLCVVDCDLPPEQIAKRFPHLANYLQSARKAGIENRRLLTDRRIWYQQEQRDPPPFLCTYMGRGSKTRAPLRFIWNKSKAIATNTYLLLYPKPHLAEMIEKDRQVAPALYEALRAIPDTEMQEHARTYAGGMLKIEPKELANVRVILPANLIAANPQQELPLF